MRKNSEETSFFELDIDNSPKLAPEQKAALEALASMPEGAIPPIADFSRFHRAGKKRNRLGLA